MEDCTAESKASVPTQPADNGRIGPPDVILDILSNVGTLIMEQDRLGVSLHWMQAGGEFTLDAGWG